MILKPVDEADSMQKVAITGHWHGITQTISNRKTLGAYPVFLFPFSIQKVTALPFPGSWILIQYFQLLIYRHWRCQQSLIWCRIDTIDSKYDSAHLILTLSQVGNSTLMRGSRIQSDSRGRLEIPFVTQLQPRMSLWRKTPSGCVSPFRPSKFAAYDTSSPPDLLTVFFLISYFFLSCDYVINMGEYSWINCYKTQMIKK